MRALIRTEEPAVLTLKAALWNQQWVNKRLENAAAIFSWYVHDKKTARDWILPDLRAMTGGHCTFCDAFPLQDTSLEPIEHFRPKHDDRFHHLAFTWSNLYYCCDRCQGEKKGQWDDRLIAPDEDGYRLDDFFEFDVASGEILPNRFAQEDKQQRAAETIRIFGLNRGGRPGMRRRALLRWSRSEVQVLDDEAYRDYIECGSLAAAKQANGETLT